MDKVIDQEIVDAKEYDAEGEWRLNESECERFVQLILQAAIDNLEWHGRDADAISQVKYLKDTR